MKLSQAQNSPFYRKGRAICLKAPRTLRRISATVDTYQKMPPILVNSIPKSGTHLVLKIAQSLPGTYPYNQFVAQIDSLTLRQRSPNAVASSISKTAPGEVFGGHIHYSEDVEIVLKNLNIVQLFVIRDPRDIAVSTAHYLDQMVYWNKISRHMKSCQTTERRLLDVINGVPHLGYPNLNQRLSAYLPWMKSPYASCIRFENAKDHPMEVARQVLQVFESHRDKETGQIAPSIDILAASLKDTNSHTFRAGKTNGWREHFTPTVSKAYDAVCGDLTERMGY